MDITVAICTWNRAKLLEQTLSRFESLTIPFDLQWELVVVNNGCTDNTDAVLAKYSATLPIKRVFERKPGHSNSRNCAIDNAHGDLIVWTDDDVLVSKQWLVEYMLASKRHPQAAFFGGPIGPWFEGTPPTWLKSIIPTHGHAFALRDLGQTTLYFNKCRLPFGANFAIRAATQRAFRYDPNLGRKHKGMLGGDETTVLRAILDSGGTGLWIPSAGVEHFIPKTRQSVNYLFRYFQGVGQVEAMTEGSVEGPMLFGRPRWQWRRAVEAAIRFYASRWLRPPEVWCRDLAEFACCYGRLSSSERLGGQLTTEK